MLWLDTFIHWLHLTAAAVWAGGMIFTGIVLAPVARKELPPAVRIPLFNAVGRRFAVVGRSALAVLLLTGAYKLSQIWSVENFWTSTPGKLISLKLCLVFVMLVLSLWHDFVWGPRLLRWSDRRGSPEYGSTLARLSFWSRVNVALVLAIVFLGAAIRMNPF